MYKNTQTVINVENTKAQITDFLNKCEEVRKCKFIMATTKIKDLLKSIVNSAELYELFNTVAANFDYVAAKKKCFIESDGMYGHSRVQLPDTVGERLAFIFCLLVEFDRNDIGFNAFLQKYYPKDGSYYASYHLFCDEIIGSLEALVSDIFSEELAGGTEATDADAAAWLAHNSDFAQGVSQPDVQTAELITTIGLLIGSEKEGVAASTLTEEEKEAANSLLDGLASAVRSGDGALIKALTCGYNYFVLYTVFVSEGLSDLFSALGAYLSRLNA